jgi:sigma-B regulation protein RsbU (phosphoserine phosphatase)
MRILIADDDPVSLRLLARTLENWGHETVLARDGEEAWRLFQGGTIHVVISDWVMPGMDGLELVRRIRGLSGPAYVYVILLTAKAQPSDLVEGMNAGADDFITKPFDQAELRVRLGAGERVVRLESTLAEQNALMRRDLEAAAAVQRCLLPHSPPKVEGFQFAWEFVPSAYVAGDIFNLHRLDERTLGLYVLDVSGHGVPAAMLAVTLSKVLMPLPGQDCLVKHHLSDPPHFAVVPPAAVIAALNDRFPMASQSDLYHTVIYGTLDVPSRRLRLARAGHPEPIRTRDGRAEVLEIPGSLPAGMCAGTVYPETEVPLQPGDRLYFFSDGLLEAVDEEGTPFGEERLAEALGAVHALPLDQAIRQALATVRNVDPEGVRDDVTLLALEAI